MKVLQVNIEKFKIVENLNIDLDGKNLLLLGDNEVGKSSVIQFIKLALGYTDHMPEIEEGKGYIVTNKDGIKYVFKLTYKNGKPKLVVESEDGLKDDRKSIINSIVGGVDFDIDEFVRLSETSAGRKQQVEIYKSLLDPEIVASINDLERRIKIDFDERTEINREVKRIEAVVDRHEGRRFEPGQEIDITALAEELRLANENNNKRRSAVQTFAQYVESRDQIEKQIAELTLKLNDLNKRIETGKEMISQMKEIDVNALTQKLSNANEINHGIRMANEYKKEQEELFKQKGFAEDLTVRIETSRQSIADAIKDMPVIEGLLFDSEGLLYDNIPVSPTNLSTSKIMELGVKLNMVKNKQLGILFIERCESLGEKRLHEIQEMAKENNWQLIMEQVVRGEEKLIVEIQEP